MKKRNLFSATTKKSIQEFIESLRKNAGRFNFGIRYLFDMKEEYKRHNVDVDDDFQLYQIVLCNFQRSYKTIRGNIETAAVLLQPKQVIVYNNREMTTINYLPLTKEFINQALPEDKEFAIGLYESCQKIVKLIKASL